MADRYWVGGTGLWDANPGTKWSLTSGGVGGEAVPTAADDVYIDSGSGAVTVSVSGTRVCRDLRFVSNAGAFTGTFASTGFLTISGSMVLSASMTHTHTGALTFNATDAQTITSNGVSIDSSFTFNGVGGVWTLQDNISTGPTRVCSLTNGTLDLNNNTFTIGRFASSATNIRTLAFGTGKFICTAENVTIFSCSNSTNLTVTGTPIVEGTYSGSTGTRNVIGYSAVTYNPSNPLINFNITAGTDIVAIGGNTVYGNVNFTGFTGSYGFTGSDPQLLGNLTFDAGMTGPSSATRSLIFNGTSGTQTITSNGVTIDSAIIVQGGSTCVFADALAMGATNTFTITAGTVQLKNGVTSTVGSFVANNSNAKFLQSTTPGSQATLSQASGTVNVVDLTIQDINAVGGASWNAYTDFENIDAGNNDGWNFSLSPPYSTAELPITLRSFTQPRRF